MGIAVVYRQRGAHHRGRGWLRHRGARCDDSTGRTHRPRRSGVHLHRGGRVPATAVRLRRGGSVRRRDPRRGSVVSLRADGEVRLAVRNAHPPGAQALAVGETAPRSGLAWTIDAPTGRPWRRRAATRPRELCAWKWKQRRCSPSADTAVSMLPPPSPSAITFSPRITGPTPSAPQRYAKPQSGYSTQRSMRSSGDSPPHDNSRFVTCPSAA